MPDGVRLAADLCLPERRGEHGRFPGLLEYLPDRTDEGRGGRFSDVSYFVRNGYAVARVDIRGTDRVVIDWLAKQPFSSGRAGMFGISSAASIRSRWRCAARRRCGTSCR